MGKLIKRRVAVQKLASHCQEYPYVFRSVSGIKIGEFSRSGSGMVPESIFGGFSEIVPEWFRNPILVGFPKWFRNGSGSIPCIA